MALGDILKGVLPAGARERIYSTQLIEKRWEEIVGYELARRSEPEALLDGVLTVRVTDVAWGKMFYRLQGRIVPAINKAVGSRLVKRINFTKRSQLERPMGPKRVVEPRDTSPPPAAVIEAASAIEEPELKELVLRSAAHYLSAQEKRRRK